VNLWGAISQIPIMGMGRIVPLRVPPTTQLILKLLASRLRTKHALVWVLQLWFHVCSCLRCYVYSCCIRPTAFAPTCGHMCVSHILFWLLISTSNRINYFSTALTLRQYPDSICNSVYMHTDPSSLDGFKLINLVSL